MSKKAKINLLKYGISAAICIGIGLAYALSRDIANLPLVDVYRILSDAFTLPALLFLFSGTMVWLSNEGALDGISYLLTSVVRFLVPGGALKREKYGDYVERRREKNLTGYSFLFIVGLICMAGTMVFFALYKSIH